MFKSEIPLRNYLYKKKYKHLKDFNPNSFIFSVKDDQQKLFFLCQNYFFYADTDLEKVSFFKTKLNYLVKQNGRYWGVQDKNRVWQIRDPKQLYKTYDRMYINNNSALFDYKIMDDNKEDDVLFNILNRQDGKRYEYKLENGEIKSSTYQTKLSESFALKREDIEQKVTSDDVIEYKFLGRNVSLNKESGKPFYREDVSDPNNRLRLIICFSTKGVEHSYGFRFNRKDGSFTEKRIDLFTPLVMDYYSDQTRKKEYFDYDFSFMNYCDYSKEDNLLFATYNKNKLLLIDFNKLTGDTIALNTEKLELNDCSYDINYLKYFSDKKTLVSGSFAGDLDLFTVKAGKINKDYQLSGLKGLITEVKLKGNELTALDSRGNIAFWNLDRIKENAQNNPAYTYQFPAKEKVINFALIDHKKRLFLLKKPTANFLWYSFLIAWKIWNLWFMI